MTPRHRLLLQQQNALSAAKNPALPQHIRALYAKAAEHGRIALGLQDAIELKRQRERAAAEERELRALLQPTAMLPGLAAWLRRHRPAG
jgi:hypothetical protein